MNKLLYIIMVLSGSAILASCSSAEKKTDTANEATGNHNHEHIFSCPMHPEVRGHEGDKCPKCGMPLEHMDELTQPSANYKMNFKAKGAAESGKPVVLSFTPENTDKPGEPVPLDEEHEKKIHLIVVSNDLRWFDHIHPEYNADGSYNVPETFPYAGDYIMYADYKPSNASHKVDKIPLTVSGKAAPTHRDIITEQLVYLKDGLKLTLEADGPYVSGKNIKIKAVLTDNGNKIDAATLENYLGAKAHTVMIESKDKNYMHVHPGIENGSFDLSTTFSTPGTYRAWIQFMYKGKLQTADFTIPVKQGDLLNIGTAEH